MMVNKSKAYKKEERIHNENIKKVRGKKLRHSAKTNKIKQKKKNKGILAYY